MDFLPVVSSTPAATPAAGAPVAAGAAGTAEGDAAANFLKLLAQLISAPQASGDAALPEVAGLELDSSSKEADDRDTDESAEEDAAAFSMLAFLPTLFAPPPPPANSMETAAGSVDEPASQALSSATDDALAAFAKANAESGAATDSIKSPLSEWTTGARDAVKGSELIATALTSSATAALTQVAANIAALTADASDSTTGLGPLDPNSNAQASQLHAAAAAHARSNGDAPPPAEMRAPLGTPAWKDELGAQLTWMAHNGRESASLRLSPQDLGPLEIRISMHQGEASVWFGAANADTRSALDQSLPRLREMFASQGMVLADAGVFKEAPQQQNKAPVSFANSPIATEAGEAASATQISAARLRLLDTYA